jgi:hypothetical protein
MPSPITGTSDGWLVPKQELVSNLQVLLQARRLKVAQTLPDAPTLVQELLNFKIKTSTAANNTFEAGTVGQGVVAIDLVAAAVNNGLWSNTTYSLRPFSWPRTQYTRLMVLDCQLLRLLANDPF